MEPIRPAYPDGSDGSWIRLPGKASDAVGNGQPYDDHVNGQSQGQVIQVVWTSGMQSREWQDNQPHNVFDGSAKEQAAD